VLQKLLECSLHHQRNNRPMHSAIYLLHCRFNLSQEHLHCGKPHKEYRKKVPIWTYTHTPCNTVEFAIVKKKTALIMTHLEYLVYGSCVIAIALERTSVRFSFSPFPSKMRRSGPAHFALDSRLASEISI